MQIRNPFSKIRTEQMGNSAWKYYVESNKEYISYQPLIFEGSRGTGKTMFFRCNSWHEKYSEILANNKTLQDYLKSNKHIGFYYKADGRFVKGFSNKDIRDDVWTGIFNTYFNIIVLKEIIPFILVLNKNELIDSKAINNVFNLICDMLNAEKVEKLEDFDSTLDQVLANIEVFSNNTETKQPIGLNSGTLIEKILNTIKKNELLNDTTFHVFIDEFEVFSKSQQVEINTLLKQSNSNVVYDYGVITGGILTKLTSTGQEIQPKNDYQYFSADKFVYHESKEYNDLLEKICQKRLIEELSQQQSDYKEEQTKISFYLKNYGKRHEEGIFITKNAETAKLKERIFSELKKHSRMFNYSSEETQSYYKRLTDCTPILLRIHLALLLRRGKYTVQAKDLVSHFENKTREYKEWRKNMETAVIYLLCHEFKVQKKYHGFQVYSALSSGVIRSFLELAEYAFDYAFNNSENPFSFDKPRELTIEEQTKAVYFISNFKINEISSYEPFGHKLKEFTCALGKIFHALQTDPDATLGEVEQNHFITTTNELLKNSPEAEQLLKNAIKYKILEEGEPTKTKSNDIIEFTDYHLNHIYCPAFKISHLRKRKIQISHNDLAKLLCGTHKELEEVVRKLSKNKSQDAINLFTNKDDLSGEI